ncbi:MAG TPA: glycosyltransferase [Phycisphaerales bacterium]|nr:glycosyltransferase [Phycisphaerales bacterium]
MLSQRRLHPDVSRCCNYELEDVVCAMDSVDMVAPQITRAGDIADRGLRKVSRVLPVAARLNPFPVTTLERDYDLFFASFQFMSDVLSLNAVRGWRKRCRTAVCVIDELWAGRVREVRGLMRLLDQFDHVFLGCRGSLEPFARASTAKASYMAPGVDAITFCPYPQPPERSIDVFNMGRRSPVTHAGLAEWSRRKGRWYIFDTVHLRTFQNHAEHRQALANSIKRTKFFIANQAKFNRGHETLGQAEVGFRFFEGTAGGAVLVGNPPETPHFEQLFGKDIMVAAPSETADLGRVLEDLERDPERLERMRRQGVRCALLRHDWLHRWKEVLKVAGLELLPAAIEREARLRQLSAFVEEAPQAEIEVRAGAALAGALSR